MMEADTNRGGQSGKRAPDPRPWMDQNPHEITESIRSAIEALATKLVPPPRLPPPYGQHKGDPQSVANQECLQQPPVVGATSSEPLPQPAAVPPKPQPDQAADAHTALSDTSETIEPLKELTSLLLSMCLSNTSIERHEAVVNEVVCPAKLKATLSCARQLPMGSDAQLAMLRQGCDEADATVGHGTTLILAVHLKLLSWETDGGAMLPMKAEEYLSALGTLYKNDPRRQDEALELAGAFWTGVALRLCTKQHLTRINVLANDWGVSPAHRSELMHLKALTTSELEAVHVLASPTSLTGQWSASPKLFNVRIKALLNTLGMLANREYRTEDVKFLLDEVNAALAELLQTVAPKPGTNPNEEQLRNLARVDPVSHTGGAWPMHDHSIFMRSGMPFDFSSMMPVIHQERDVLPDQVTSALGDFMREKEDHFRAITEVTWEVWLAEVMRAEPFFACAKNPAYRGRPGFSLYRDRYIRLLKDFASAFRDHMDGTDLQRLLRDTPSLCTIMCGGPQPDVWPQTAMNTPRP
jgi:hypothetical protein